MLQREQHQHNNMKRFRKILVNLTLDETDRSVVRYINHFSKISGAERVEFICVLPQSEQGMSESQSNTDGYEYIESVNSEIAQLLEQYMENVEGRNLKITVARGHMEWEVLRHALKEQFDLIALEKDHRNFLFSEKITRKAPCSVLLVNPSAEPNFRKVAIASDGSRFSREFLELSGNLVINQNLPKLFLVHCIELGWMERLRNGEENSESSKLQAAANKQLDELTAIFNDAPFEISKFFTEDSEAWRGIRDFCEHLDPDILIVGARGKDSRSQLLLGGNTEQLIRVINSPLLVYRSKGVGNEILQKLLDAEL